MGVGIVKVAERTKVDSTKAGDAEVVVVIEAIEGAELVGYPPIESGSGESFIKWYAEGLCKCREVLYVAELLAVLIVILEFSMPEHFVTNEKASRAPAKDLAIERWLSCCRTGFVQTQI